MLKMLERIKIDMWLFIPLVLISIFGLLILYSASNQSIAVVESQLMKLTLGFGLMIFISQMNPIKIRVWSPKFYIFILILLLGVACFGELKMGARRWLDVGFMTLQPSELMKLALPMMLGWVIYKQGMPTHMKTTVIYALIILLPVGFVINQPDLGTSILIAAAGIFLLFQAGLSYTFIFYSVSMILSAMPFLWFLLKEYQRQRILTLINPEADPQGSGYHIIQSKIAISSGGATGKGYLEGTQSHLGFIPEQKTDFIFSVLSEEMGFKGFAILMSLYLVLIFRILSIIYKSNDVYEKLVSGSILMVFVLYIFVNIGMVTGILPVVGVPLPMVSFGGTSIITLLISFGIVSSFSVHSKTKSIMSR
jgi:rod shape determining protein RodA